VERELRVDRCEAVDLDHRVHALAALEAVLELIRLRGQPVAEQVAEQELTEAAARLRRAEHLLELAELLRLLGERRRRPPDVAELLVDRVRLLRRVLEAAVDLVVERAQPPVHRLRDPLQAPLDVAVPLVEARLGLPPERLPRP